MMDRETLEGFLAIIADGGTLVCNAATRDRLVAAFRAGGVEVIGKKVTGVRIRITAHYADGHVTAIALDCGDPLPFALTGEATP
jgi:hypothetical protein